MIQRYKVVYITHQLALVSEFSKLITQYYNKHASNSQRHSHSRDTGFEIGTKRKEYISAVPTLQKTNADQLQLHQTPISTSRNDSNPLPSTIPLPPHGTSSILPHTSHIPPPMSFHPPQYPLQSFPIPSPSQDGNRNAPKQPPVRGIDSPPVYVSQTTEPRNPKALPHDGHCDGREPNHSTPQYTNSLTLELEDNRP